MFFPISRLILLPSHTQPLLARHFLAGSAIREKLSDIIYFVLLLLLLAFPPSTPHSPFGSLSLSSFSFLMKFTKRSLVTMGWG
jgi:hypothetical protein